MKSITTLIFASFFLLLIMSKSTFSQSEVQEQLNKIDGNVDKITITADGKEYTFEGKDAEKLFKKMKGSDSHSFAWHTSDDSKKEKVIILDGDDDDVFVVKSGDDFDWNTEGINKKVKVKVENGEKTVTVTTKENGTETTKVYTGDEADEYLDKMKSENDDFDIQIDSDKDCKKMKKIIIKTEEEETVE